MRSVGQGCALLFSLLSFSLLGACGGSQQSAAEPTPATQAAAVPATFAEQVSLGGQLYAANCASCHGASGEGSAGAPAVVGLAAGALPVEPRAGSSRTSRFVTVADVATYAVATMPPAAPGGLSAEEYWAILAFDLHANGIDLEQKLTPELAATLTIPR
jgi:mono/diheme cytochrome c family protein